MREYELVLVVSPEAGEEGFPVTVDRVHGLIKERGGEVKNVDRWGRRRLAYPLDRFTEGYYSITQFTLDPQDVRAIEGSLDLADDVLRHLVVRMDEPIVVKPELDPDAPIEAPAAKPAEGAEKPSVEASTEAPAEKPAEGAEKPSAEASAEAPPAEKPAEGAEKPSVEASTEAPAEKPAEGAEKPLAEESTEAPAEESAEPSAKDTTEAPAEESPEAPAEKPPETPAEESPEAPAEKPAEPTAEG